MTSDRLADLVRRAVETVDMPPYPATGIAKRIAAGAPPPREDRSRRPLGAIAGGLLLVTALAVAVPNRSAMSDAARRTIERLTGWRLVESRSYEVRPMSLAEARRHTTFPIVVPAGFRIVDAEPAWKNRGITLTIADRKLGVVMLTERWTDVPASKLEGIGVHDDGSIRRFNVRRWTIGRIAFSVPMFDPTYHAFAERIERATRLAAAHGERVPGAATR